MSAANRRSRQCETPTGQGRSRPFKRGVKLWPIGTDTAKSEIYGRLRLEQPGPGFVHLSSNLPGEVFEQITAERLVTRYVKGRPKLEWLKPAGRRNEALDCAVYALACVYYLQMDRWRAGDWQRWEDRVQTRDLFDQAATAAPAPEPEPETVEPKPRSVGKRRRGTIGAWR